MVTNCVEAFPDLSMVRSGINPSQREHGISLKQAREYYDRCGIQRIAVLGSARVFPYKLGNDIVDKSLCRLEELRKKKADHRLPLEEREVAELRNLEDRLWSVLYLMKAQDGMNELLDCMGDDVKYTTLNGGWAGVRENGMGMPMISSLFGIVHNNEAKGLYPPITIMPEGGNYDRVKTILDYRTSAYLSALIIEILERDPGVKPDHLKSVEDGIYNFFMDVMPYLSRHYNEFVSRLSVFVKNKGVNPNFLTEELYKIFIENGYQLPYEKAYSTYFEIQGTWGDDSKYLVALSTGLLVFYPYGFWTNIEIANGVIQGKPVAVIDRNVQLEDGHEFREQEIALPNSSLGSYRIYKKVNAAVKWINERYLIENRSKDEFVQKEYDRRFGLMPYESDVHKWRSGSSQCAFGTVKE